jgi:hypothetical protein
MWPVLVLATILSAARASAGADAVAYLGARSGGRCAPAVEVTGMARTPARATFSCVDGDPSCDQDGVTDGRCTLWVRHCLNHGTARCTPDTIGTAALEGNDPQVAVGNRLLAALSLPTAERERCTMMTSLAVPARSRETLRLRLTTTDGAHRRAAANVRFRCRPPGDVRIGTAISFDAIARRTFARSCATGGCHDAKVRAGGLTLAPAFAHEQLVGRASVLGRDRALRVDPGNPRGSFLLRKLWGTLQPGEGARMPLHGPPLGAAEIETLVRWITAGAPREGRVAGKLREAEAQPRDPALAPPADGYQLVTDAALLGDQAERLSCQYVRLPNAAAEFVRKWEIQMYGGSHHFDIFRVPCTDENGNGIDDCDEPDFDARFGDGHPSCEVLDRLALTPWVSSQGTRAVLDAATERSGLAWALRPRQPLILNSHFVNRYRDTIAVAWVNVWRADPATVRHPIESFFDQRLYDTLMVAPGTERWVSDHACTFADCDATVQAWPAPAASHFVLLGFSSHSHWRARKVVADLFDVDGRKITPEGEAMRDVENGSMHFYVSTDWAHPSGQRLTPPLVVARGQQLRYSCLYDNGVARPVRLGCEEEAGVPPGRSRIDAMHAGRGAAGGTVRGCRTDLDCQGIGTGRCVPANLVWGPTSEDGMCAVAGDQYPCAGGGADCLPGARP